MQAIRMTPAAKIATSPEVNRPGEQVVLDRDYAGRILCGVLVIRPGVRADVVVHADEVFFHGDVSGHVLAKKITIAEDAAYVGSSRCGQANIAGRVNGLTIARTIVMRDGSVLEGDIVADRMERQVGTTLLASIAVGPGMTENKLFLSRAQARFDRRQGVVVATPREQAGVVTAKPREPSNVVEMAASAPIPLAPAPAAKVPVQELPVRRPVMEVAPPSRPERVALHRPAVEIAETAAVETDIVPFLIP